MALLIINRKKICINKFLIYGVVLFMLLYPTIIKDIYYALTFKKAKGEVISFIVTENKSGKKNSRYYPVINFVAGDSTYECFGSQYEHQSVYLHDSVKVIYDPNNPSKAFSYSFNGFWSPELVYVLPFALLLTLLAFLDSIPAYITLKLQTKS